MKKFKATYINVWNEKEIHFHKSENLAMKEMIKAYKSNEYDLKEIILEVLIDGKEYGLLVKWDTKNNVRYCSRIKALGIY